MRTLRVRFVLSHILPLLVVVALMGIALVYVLETQVLLPRIMRDLTGDGILLGRIARDQLGVWTSPARSQEFVVRTASNLGDTRVALLDAEGRLLASSEPAARQHVGQPLDSRDVNDIQASRVRARLERSGELGAEIANVLVPVRASDGHVLGAVRLSLVEAGVIDELIHLRYLIGGILAAGGILGGLVGWALAVQLERPLGQLTRSVSEMVDGRPWQAPVWEDPEEIAVLVRAFNSLVERLHSLEEGRHHLLANLVHEIARPIGALRSAVDALERGADEDVLLRRELLAGVGDELVRLQHLLDDLAQLHERVLGTLELNRRPTILSDWLPRVLAPWREAAQRQGLNWNSTVPADLPRLEIDPDRLAQALGNLVSNALKYTPAGGSVSVEAGLKDGGLQIRVSDTGPGMTTEEQRRIFEPLYRGPQSRRFPQGMGLGLTIARDLVVAHGGWLHVESAPGQGSRFTLWIASSDGSAASRVPGQL